MQPRLTDQALVAVSLARAAALASDRHATVADLLAALAVAWASIGWLLRYVARHSFVAFGVYRIVAGVVILLLVQLRVL